MNTTELTTELKESVRQWHNEAMRIASGAADGLQKALDAGANCGDAIRDYLEQHKGQGLADLRDVLPHGQAKAYLRLATIRAHRGLTLSDASAIKALPLFGGDQQEDDDEPSDKP